MRKLLIVVAAVAFLIPLLHAQQGGVQADGWQHRLDRDGNPADVLNFMSMGSGVHAQTAGRGAAIFWQPGDGASGNFTISASFTQMEPSSHPNAFGLFLGGSNLKADDQQYSYFVIREDGQFLIKKRMGSETSNVVAWTRHDAINTLNAQGSATNTLAVEVGASQVRFLVNDTEVSSQPRSSVDTDGVAGLRVTHQLNVHIDALALSG
jgi:hypothetical protein